MASGPVRRSSRLLGKAQDWHKVYQAWCAMEFLLISSKTGKETFARCLSISGHGNSSRLGKLYQSGYSGFEVHGQKYFMCSDP